MHDMAAGEASPVKPLSEAHGLEVSFGAEGPEEFEEYRYGTRTMEDTRAQVTKVLDGINYHIKELDRKKLGNGKRIV